MLIQLRCHLLMIYSVSVDECKIMGYWWNGTDRRKLWSLGGGGGTFPSASLSNTDLTATGLGLNPGLSDDRPANNRLSHGTALG